MDDMSVRDVIDWLKEIRECEYIDNFEEVENRALEKAIFLLNNLFEVYTYKELKEWKERIEVL